MIEARAGVGGDEAALFAGEHCECTNDIRQGMDGNSKYYHWDQLPIAGGVKDASASISAREFMEC